MTSASSRNIFSVDKMFQNLKSRIVTEANRANQAIISAVLQTDNKPSSNDSGIRTSSISSRDENNDINRSRLSSASSDISQVANYISPTAQYPPPSDFELEQTGDESDSETNSKLRKLLVNSKNKFIQLKHSYDEIDRERNRVKELLQKQQDISFKQREKFKQLQQEKDQIELSFQHELQVRDMQIEEFHHQLKRKNESEQEENRNLREKITKLEGSISKFQEKQASLIIERDQVLQQLHDFQSTSQSVINVEPLKQEIIELKSKCEAFDSLKIEYRNQINESAQLKQAIELSFQQELQVRDSQIEQLNQQLERKNESEQEENLNLREKITKLEASILKFQEKQANLIIERDLQSTSQSEIEYRNLVNESAQLKQEKERIELSFQHELQVRDSQIEQLNQQLERKNESEQEENRNLREKQISLINERDQVVQQLHDLQSTSQSEIETLKDEIVALVKLNEENTRRIDEYVDEKFNFEQEIIDKDRQIVERDEKIQDLELIIKQTQESSDKLRKALQKLKDSMNNTNEIDDRVQKVTEDYEQRLKDQQMEHDSKLKALAKEMNFEVQENQRKYQQQLDEYIETNVKSDNETIQNAEQKVVNAEKRALTAENYLFKLEEDLKVKQLDHYQVVRDLQIEIEKLKKQLANYQTVTDEQSCQTELSESVEIDYLKRVFQGYLNGTDRITMARVICAVLKYTDDETSVIIEQEKFRQSRWLNS